VKHRAVEITEAEPTVEKGRNAVLVTATRGALLVAAETAEVERGGIEVAIEMLIVRIHATERLTIPMLIQMVLHRPLPRPARMKVKSSRRRSSQRFRRISELCL
jgi:hypothetical protein